MSSRLLWAAAAALVVFLPAAVLAQDARGTILGRVTDPSEAVIPGAEVRVTNAATGVAVVAKTNQAGNYVLAYLLPGAYRLEAETTGFKKFVRENIEVRVGDTLEIDIAMQVGTPTETVQVTAETPLLQTAEASVGQVVDERRIMDLPSFGGGVYGLALVAPGAMNTTNLRQRYVGTPYAQSDFAVDGAGRMKNEFTIDGVANTMDGTIVFVPPQTSVSEFKVQSASYDASIGHTSGALVNLSLKSGTNELHGEAHFILRNRVFDTPTIFQNRTAQTLPAYQDQRYGLGLGGPVILPKLYNGKNKTFWFYNWEKNWLTYPYDYISSVPTDEMRRGDLSPFLALGSNYQIYDPFTTRPAPGGRFTRDPIPNNVIPPSRLDTVAKNILNYWPKPNQPGTREFRNNFYTTFAGPFPVWTHLARVDHAFSSNHRMYVRFMREGFWSTSNKTFLSDYDGGQFYQDKRGFAFDDVYVLNPSFFVNFRYGLTHRWGSQYRLSRGFDLAKLGFSPGFLALLPDKKNAVFPTVVTGLTPLSWNGRSDGKWSTVINSFNLNFTKLRGEHSFRFGTEFRVYREFENYYPFDITPYLSFSDTYTRGPLDNSPGPPVSGTLAAFLLGIPGGYMNRSANLAQQDKYLALYFHDDLKVTPKLTLNLGLRYELESPITERFNRSVAGFAFDQPSPIEAQARANYAASPIPELPVDQFRVRGGLAFAGVGGTPRNLWTGEKNNLMPRIGFAYQIRPKTVLRGGYGLFFDSLGVNSSGVNQTGFSMSTPIQASLDSGQTYIARTADPFPNGLLEPFGAKGGLATNLGQSVSFFANKRTHPYAQRWSFGFQQLLPGQFLAEASYVGNRGTRLPVTRNLNFVPAQYLSRSPVRDQKTIDYLSQQFPSPLFGTNPIYGRNISRAGLLLPYPQFGGVNVTEPIGYSWYHSLQVRSEKRFSHGWTFQMSYTWSKTMEATGFMNASDPMPYESLSAQDRTHRLVGSWIWELPFGRGRRFGGTMPRALDFVAGGWQINGMVQRQSGPPLDWGDVWTLFTGNPDDVRLPKNQRSVDRWFNIDAGFNRNSAQQLGSNIRVSPWRFNRLGADGQARWDFAAIKSFKLVEKATLQFRAEVVNAWNHPNVYAPTTSPTSSTFGMIFGQDHTRSWIMSLWLKF
ncbi:MAG: carboxypeptidase regulatory-like domain-containing protein [Acidobacteriota bacterium]